MNRCSFASVRLGAARRLLHALVVLVLLAAHALHGQIRFSEDFESYLVGSNLIGQGGWFGWPDPMVVKNAGPLPTKILDGVTTATGSRLTLAGHAIPGGLLPGVTTVLSFDAYGSSQGSANSWVGLSQSSDGLALTRSVIWDFNRAAHGGWGLEIRQAGVPYVSFPTGGGVDAPAKLTIAFDRARREVWGTYDFGGGPVETPHYPVLEETLAAMDAVNIGFDFRGTRGVQVDNIQVRVASCAAPPSGLIAWWPGDGNARDLTGTSHGALQNGATFGAGFAGASFQFDGEDDFALVQASDALNAFASGDFSVDAWIRLTSPTPGYDDEIAGKWDVQRFRTGATRNFWRLYLERNTHRLVTGWGAQGVSFELKTTEAIAVNRWTHVVLVRQADHGYLFIDGNLAADAVLTAAPLTNTDPLAFGGLYDTLHTPPTERFNTFGGQIDELALFNRALSSNEIAALHAAGSAGMCQPVCVPPPSGLIAWWSGDGTTNDSEGGYNGTLAGGATFAAGKVAQGFRFSAVAGERFAVPHHSNLELESLPSATFEGWFKSSGGGDAAIVSKHVCGFPNGWFFATMEGGFMGDHHIGGVGVGGLNLNDGQFHHFAVVKDGTNYREYVDGTLISSDTGPASGTPNTTSIQMGGINGGSCNNYGQLNGIIDEITLYNRALSTVEIQAIFNAGSAGKCQPAATNCVPPPPALFGWWSGDGNASDRQGNNHGILRGGASATEPGVAGNAFRFDSLSDAVEIPNSASLQFGTNDFAVACWFKGSSSGYLMTKYGAPGTFTGIGLFVNGQGQLEFYAADCVTGHCGWGSSRGAVIALARVDDNRWHHVAGVRVADGYLLYVDGQLMATRPEPARNVDGAGSLWIGNYEYAAPFLGLIDEFLIVKRALSSNEVAAIHAAGSAGLCKPQCVPPPSGLVSWWPGDGNAVDFSGTNHGTLQNGVTFAAGVVGQAFSFVGPIDIVRVAHNSNLNVGTGDITIDAWVQFGDPTFTNDRVIVMKSSSSAPFPGYTLRWLADKLQFIIDSELGGLGSSVQDKKVETTIMRDTRWHHVAAVRRGLAMELYYDGLVVANATYGSLEDTDNVADIGIGNFVGSRDNEFPGLIDEVAIFNRALSSNEIAAIHAAGSAGLCKPQCVPPPADMVAWWSGDGTASDSLGVNHGTLRNGATFAAGLSGQAFQFDGVDDVIEVPNPSFQFGTGDLTVAAWFKANAGLTRGFILSRFTTGSGEIGFRIEGGQLMFYAADCTSGGCGWGSSRGPVISPARVDDGQWHHGVGIRTAQGYSLYFDGQLVATRAEPARDVNSLNSLFIGNLTSGAGGLPFSGLIDEVLLLNRALSSNEIAAIYAAGSAGLCKPTQPPSIVTQPTNFTVFVTLPAQFSVAAAGSAPLRYQWRLNGGGLPGATNAMLALPNVQPPQAGDYTVVVSNPLGAVTSGVARLTVRTDIADLAVTGVSGPASIQAGQAIPIMFTLTNQGTTAAVGPWLNRVFLANDATGLGTQEIATVPQTNPLPPNASVSFMQTVNLPPRVVGRRFVGVTADMSNAVFELNKSNNTALAVASIQILAPDLQVTNLSVSPAALQSGGLVTVGWEDVNNGLGFAGGAWHDRVAVSNLSLGQLVLATNIYFDATTRGNIGSGAAKSNFCQLRLPDGLPGTGALQFIVTADIQDTVAEDNEAGSAEANNTAALTRASTLANYPDLLVTDIGSPSNGVPGQPIQVSWTITNQGLADAAGVRTDALSLSTDPFIGDDQILQNFDLGRTIAAGQSVIVTQSVILPGALLGDRYFVVTVNSGNRLFELVTTNNTAIATQAMATLNPDLVVQSVTGPGGAEFGQSFNVEWTVRNAGAAAASVNWSDQVYLSASSNSVSGADVLLTRPAARTLAAGASYTNSRAVSVPLRADRPPGRYFLVVWADAGGVQPESNEGNNLGFQPITLTHPPLPDLAVTNVTIPLTALPDQIVPMSWTVVNRGSAPASGAWMESLYFSADAAPGNDPLLVSYVFTNDLASGGFLTRTQEVRLPATGAAGELFVIVQVDAQNGFFESDESNNAAFSTNTMNVTPALTLHLPVAQVSENAANPNLPATISRNGEVASPLLVTMTTSDTNELRIGAPAIPSPPVPLAHRMGEGAGVRAAGVGLGEGQGEGGRSSFTIPAGQSTAAFNLTVIPDGLVDSNKLVTVTATAPGFLGSTGTVTVINTDLPRLSLFVASPVVEEGFTTAVTVTRDGVTGGDLAVTLASSSPGNLLVPGLVTIPAHSNSWTFGVLAIDDTVVEQLRTFTITASAGGYANVSASVTVADNDRPVIALELASTNVSEGAGPVATVGTIRRPTAEGQVFVALRSSDTTAALVPDRLMLAPGQLEVSFPIGAQNDFVVDGPQEVVISAVVVDSLGGQPLGDPVFQPLTVTDDDGPTLTLNMALKVVPENRSPATTGSVRRNTSTNAALVVTLASSDTNEATVPASVTIPAGQTTANFAINTVDDGITDGGKRVTLTASAEGFTSGHDTLLVTDTDLPDLVVSTITAPESVETGSSFSIAYRVANQGLAPAGTNFQTRIYLSTDSVGGNATLLGQYVFQGVLAVGQSFDQTLQVTTPSVVGPYWVLVETDTGSQVAEIVENNNFRLSAAPVTVRPAYRATVQTDMPTVLPGMPIVLRGQALRAGSDQPVAGVSVNLHVVVGGTARIIAATTDGNGNFTATFTPLPGEAGSFTVIATHPGQATPVNNGAGNTVAFAVLGMRLEIPNVYHSLTEQEPWPGRFTLRNLADAPLTGLQVEVTQKPDNVTVASMFLEGGDALLPNGDNTLAIQLFAENATNTLGQVWLRVTSDQGVMAEGRVYVQIVRQRAHLVADTSALEASMVRGRGRTVEFRIANDGAAPTGPIALLLPPTPWLSSPLGQTLPSLAPNESLTVSLTLNPAPDLPLTVYGGSLALSSDTAQLSLNFSFRCVSEATADLMVETVDQFFYYAAGNPRLTNAQVRVLDPFTSREVARGTTDTNGFALLSALREGPYSLEVSARDHTTYRNTVILEAGVQNHHQAFLSRQMVTYTWTVEPVTIEERVTITVQANFEVNVPVPVIVVTPTIIDLSSLTRPGQTMQVDVKMTNYGLIAWQGVRIGFENHPTIEMKPLIEDIGVIPAHGDVTVPVMITYKSPAGLQAAALQAASIGACNIYGQVSGFYPCGPQQVNNATTIQGYLNCPPNPVPPPATLALLAQTLPTPIPPVPPQPALAIQPNFRDPGDSPVQFNFQPPCTCHVSINGPSHGNIGDTLNLTASGIPPNGTYGWAVVGSGATFVGGQAGQINQSAQLMLTAAGTATVHVTYRPPGVTMASGFCMADHTVTINNCSVSIAGASAGRVGETLSLHSTVSPPNGTYTWSVLGSGATLANSPGTNSSDVMLNLIAPGTVTVRLAYRPPGAATSAPPCTRDFTINVQPCSVTIVGANQGTVGTTLTLGASVVPSPNPPGTYQWSVAGPGAMIVSGQDSNSVQLLLTEPGTPLVRLIYRPPGVPTAAGDCDDDFTVTVNPCTVSIMGANQGKVGTTVTLTASVDPPGGAYTWSIAGTGAIIANSPGTNASVTLNLVEAGTVTVRLTYRPPGVTSSAGDCTSDHSITVAPCSVTITGASAGAAGCQLTVNAIADPPGGTYGWAIVGSGATLAPGQNGSSAQIQLVAPGTVMVHLTYRPPGVTTSAGDCSAVHIFNVVVPTITMITPTGDPVNAPVTSGDGQNEFTFDSSVLGIFTMTLKAQVTPCESANMIADRVRFEIDAIGDSVLSWSSANPNGMAIAVGNYLTATINVTGLPTHNSGFGRKQVRVFLDGVKQDDSICEVFYTALARNHPGGQAGVDPNWFYYWKDALFRNVPDVSYSATAIYGRTDSSGHIDIGDSGNMCYATPYNHVTFTGIPGNTRPTADGKSRMDLFYSVLTHELRHRQDYAFIAANPNSLDSDQDGLPNAIDPFPEIPNGIGYPEYGLDGDWEFFPRSVENVTAPTRSDWSEGGREW